MWAWTVTMNHNEDIPFISISATWSYVSSKRMWRACCITFSLSQSQYVQAWKIGLVVNMGALILSQPLKEKDQVFAIVTRSKLAMALTRLQYSDSVLKRETTHCLELHEIKLSLRKRKKTIPWCGESIMWITYPISIWESNQIDSKHKWEMNE